MEKTYQMSDLEHNAFIKWCKSTEVFKIVKLRKGYLYEEPASQDSIAYEDWDRSLSDDPELFFIGKNGLIYWIYETKKVRVKGYDKNAKFE